MRTTITLDDDVAARLEQIRKERGQSFKATVNELLRVGIVHANPAAETPKEYETPVHHGTRLLVDNVDNVADVIAVAEGERFK